MTVLKPWITPYKGERNILAFAFDGTQICFPQLPAEEQLRAYGVLWQPCPDNPTGEVVWKEMHTDRQREALAHGLCQVCGQPIEDRPISWPLPQIEMRLTRPRGRTFLTNTPPTCTTCVEVALESCPNLRAERPTMMAVRHYREWGVWGDLFDPRSGRVTKAQLPLGHSALPLMMARHLVVEVYDYRMLKA